MVHIMRFGCDDETGEVITYNINKETGEPAIESHSSAYFQDANNTEFSDRHQKRVKACKFPRHGYSKTKRFQRLKAKIIAGSNPVSLRLLLLPTLIFSPALCALLMIFEIFLHIRCHKKNKTLRDRDIYYRSPFHIITSMFCGVCRDSDAASKIGQIQDKRRNHYDCFRSIAI